MTDQPASDARHAANVTTAYLAAEDFEQQLAEELRLRDVPVRAVHGRLFVTDGPAVDAAWAANVWHDAREIAIDSIGDAAAKLRAIQRNWALYAPLHHRRARLIADRLPHVSAKPIEFPKPAPSAPLGSWTLLAPDRLLAAGRCSSPFANGDAVFVENHEGPPSRAYLKLWETFTRLGVYPRPGERCLDLGACPGGWTWVLANLGAAVTAVDTAPLDPRVEALAGVTWRGESAFGLDPRTVGRADWLLSDIACYPTRLLSLVQRWMEADVVSNFVCTLKFQGETDHAMAARFRSISGSQLFHLHHNKHELTWVLLR